MPKDKDANQKMLVYQFVDSGDWRIFFEKQGAAEKGILIFI